MIPNVVRWLMVARKADDWETTQETAWSVMALTDWMVVTGELHPDYTFAVIAQRRTRRRSKTTRPRRDNVKRNRGTA